MQPKDKYLGLTLDELKRHLRYDRQNGCFFRIRKTNQHEAGKRAGYVMPSGYVMVGVCGHHILAHRLVWFFETGEWPKKLLDHKDKNKSNNRIENLRQANNTQNRYNIGAFKNNHLGVKGVQLHKKSGKYRARIFVSGRHVSLGLFKTIEEASAAYAAKAKQIHKEFVRLD